MPLEISVSIAPEPFGSSSCAAAWRSGVGSGSGSIRPSSSPWRAECERLPRRTGGAPRCVPPWSPATIGRVARGMTSPRLTLITGAAGFVGRHLIDALRDDDRQLRCLVRAHEDLDAGPGVEVVTGD